MLSRKKLLYSIIFSIPYTLFFVIGPFIYAQKVTGVFSIIFLIRFLLTATGICTVLYLFIRCVPWMTRVNDKLKHIKVISNFNDMRYFFLKSFIFFFICWLPAFLSGYPGILAYDIIGQINLGLSKTLDNFHPMLHTQLIKVFLNFGLLVSGSYEIGIAAYSLCQMLLMATALANIMRLLQKYNTPVILRIFVMVFFAFWPINHILLITLVKDVFHTAFFILFASMFAELSLSSHTFLSDKKKYIPFWLCVFFMCAFRNNGIHIYGFTIFFFIVLNIKNFSVKLAVLLLTPLLLWFLYTVPLFNALHVTDGNSREALSIPIQQIERAVKSNNAEMTIEEIDYIDKNWLYIPGQTYEPFNADPSKVHFRTSNYDKNPLEFYKTWISLGLRYPGSYIFAFLSNNLEFWYPKASAPGFLEWDNYSDHKLPISVNRTSLLGTAFLNDYYDNVSYNKELRNIPVINLFFTPGFSAWYLLFAIFCIFISGKRRLLTALLPHIGLYGIMLLAPFASVRYSYPLWLALPIFLICLSYNKKEIK